MPAGFAWKIPDGVGTDDAACVPVPFGTADDCLFEFGRLRAGETALVHAGAGGVGIAAIQMAKRAGARVLATASSDDRLDRLKDLGLDEGINYVSHDFVAEARRLTEGRGVDVIVDSVGGVTLQGSIAALAYRGRCVTVGDAGRAPAEHLDISTMRPNNQTLSGYFLGAELLLDHQRVHPMIAGHLEAIARGELKVVIDRVFPLADAAGAHAYIESRQAFGRVLLALTTPREPAGWAATLVYRGDGSASRGVTDGEPRSRFLTARRRPAALLGLTSAQDAPVAARASDARTGGATGGAR